MVQEKSRDKTGLYPMVEGVAEPQGRALDTYATVVSDQHCPVAAFQHCLVAVWMWEVHIHWVGSLKALELPSPSLLLLVLHKVTKKNTHLCESQSSGGVG